MLYYFLFANNQGIVSPGSPQCLKQVGRDCLMVFSICGGQGSHALKQVIFPLGHLRKEEVRKLFCVLLLSMTFIGLNAVSPVGSRRTDSRNILDYDNNLYIHPVCGPNGHAKESCMVAFHGRSLLRHGLLSSPFSKWKCLHYHIGLCIDSQPKPAL